MGIARIDLPDPKAGFSEKLSDLAQKFLRTGVIRNLVAGDVLGHKAAVPVVAIGGFGWGNQVFAESVLCQQTTDLSSIYCGFQSSSIAGVGELRLDRYPVHQVDQWGWIVDLGGCSFLRVKHHNVGDGLLYPACLTCNHCGVFSKIGVKEPRCFTQVDKEGDEHQEPQCAKQVTGDYIARPVLLDVDSGSTYQ